MRLDADWQRMNQQKSVKTWLIWMGFLWASDGKSLVESAKKSAFVENLRVFFF